MSSCCSYRFEMALDTDVFLSHNWGKDESGRDNHQRVSLINKELKECGYETWFDEGNGGEYCQTDVSRN